MRTTTGILLMFACGFLPLLTGCSTIHDAARMGNLAEVGRRLKAGEDVNARDAAGNTPLQYVAARTGRLDVVKYLVENGADVNAPNKGFGHTPLMKAAAWGHFDTVKYLVENGADIDATNRFGQTALMWTLSKERTDVAEYLLKMGANVNIANCGQDGRRMTMLMRAVRMGKLKMVTFLVDNGADINARDNFGVTPLMYAAAASWMNLPCEKGETMRALKRRAATVYLDIAKVLVEKGADVNARNDLSQPLLSYAVDTDRKEFFKQHGATK